MTLYNKHTLTAGKKQSKQPGDKITCQHTFESGFDI